MRATSLRQLRKRARRERGAALVMVLLSIVVLTVFLTDVQQEVSTSFSSAIAARERLKAEYHARSAINLSRLLIAVEPTVRQQVAMSPMGLLFSAMFGGKIGNLPQLPVWEFADQLLGAFNGGEGAESFASLASVDMSTSEHLGLGNAGHFELVIVDEDSKINLNQAAQSTSIAADNVGMQLMGLMAGAQYDTLFERLGDDGQPADRKTICSAIVDWADFDQDRAACDFSGQNTSAGVEDNVYQSTGLGYFRKNAAYDSLDELRQVQGIGEDFWATFVDPDPRDPKKRLLTVWAQEGKVNINSAAPRVLLSFICGPNGAPDEPLCIETEQTINFLSALGMIRAFTAGAPIFSRPKEFIQAMQGKGPIGGFLFGENGAMGLKPVKFNNAGLIEQMLTTKSKVFSIYAEGVVPARIGTRQTRVSIHAVVDYRNANDLTGGAGGGTGGSSQQPGGTTQQPPPPPPPSNQVDPNAVLNALTADPAGNVIHFKIR